MKQFRLLLTLLTLLAVGSMNTWAETATLSISEGVTANGNLTDDKSNVWALSSDGVYTSNNSSYIQVGTNKKAVTYLKLTSSAFSSQNISKIQVWGTSKANTGVTVKISIGNKLLGTSTAYTTQNASSGGSEFSVENTKNYTGDITIEISRPSSATGAIYFNKAIVTYTTAPSCTKPTFTIADKTISLSEAQTGYDMSTNLIIGKGGSMGAITYSCDNSDVNIMGDKFNTSVAGTYTINATMAADATYCEATTTFTITVLSTPCTKLEKPTGLSTTNVTATSAELSWTAVPNATKYLVTYSDANVPGSKQENATATTYTLTNLTPSTHYIWSVKAIGDGTTYCDSEGSQTTGGFTTAALPKYTIIWSTPTGTSTTEVTPGDKVVLPVTNPASCSSTYTNFVGWFTEAAGSESNPSTAKPATQVTAATVPTGDATYYAVFSDGSEGNNWELVTDASTLAIGDNITFASSKTLSSTTYVIKAFADGNNWPAGQYDTTEPQTFTLQAGKVTGSWAFFDGTGYPYAANSSGSKNNHMKRQTTLTDAGSFTITISDSNTPSATIIAQTSSANGYVNLRYNSSSHLFSCYKTAQSAPYIYRKVSSATGYISSCCNDPAVVTVTPATTTINLGEDGKATTTVTCTQQNGGTAGTWSYSVSPSTATFDGTNFVATAAGEYTLTATYTETCGKSGMATITVTNTPVLYFPTPTPADPIVFGTVECGGNTPLTDKQTISLRGYNLTSDVTVTVTGDYKIAGTESAELADYATSLTLPKDAVSGSSASVYVISTPPHAEQQFHNGKGNICHCRR